MTRLLTNFISINISIIINIGIKKLYRVLFIDFEKRLFKFKSEFNFLTELIQFSFMYESLIFRGRGRGGREREREHYQGSSGNEKLVSFNVNKGHLGYL